MPRRKRAARRRPPDPSPTPVPDSPLPLPLEEESLSDLIERAARVKRTSDALIRQMKELEGQIFEAKARRQDRRRD